MSPCWNRWRKQPLDGRKDATEQSAADGNLGKLEHLGAGTADHACANFDQLLIMGACRLVFHQSGISSGRHVP